MPEPAGTLLLALTVLMVKHTVADFLVQTPYQYLNKGTYGHPGGLLHAGIHSVLTLPVFFVLTPKVTSLIPALLAGEFFIHYHVDWLKEQAVKRGGWEPDTAPFWWALGIDQLAHMLTYLAMVAILMSYAA